MKVGQAISFNTGRGYSPAGQPIMAAIIAIRTCPIFDEPVLVVHFSDAARGIAKQIEISEFTEDAIMRAYDHNLGQTITAFGKEVAA